MNYLGRTMKDRITGFTGVVTGHVNYLTGCSQVLVQPPGVNSDGNVVESRWFDIQRCEVLPGEALTFDNSATPGSDRAAPRR